MNSLSIPTRNMSPVLAALLLTPLVVTAAPVTPDAGSILQQIKPTVPPQPSSSGTGLSIERPGGEKLPSGVPFLIKTIAIKGNTRYDTATLHALVADAEGKNLTLAQLEELATRITDYYHAHGYPLARAVIPAQTIHDGAVEIEVIEARYGKIKLDNKSRVNDPLLEATLQPLQSGENIGQKQMDRSLLLLSDIPGVVVNATLKPGDVVGTSDLQVSTVAGPAVSANVTLDNYGNRYTGRARVGGTVNFIDPLQHGDYLSLSALTSGSGLNYGRIGYDTLLNGLGTRLGGSVSALHYILGDTLSNLNGHGTAQLASLWAKQPFLRSRDINLYGQIQYDNKQLKDRIDATGIRTDRHLDNWIASLSGDIRDALLAGAVSTWNLGLTSGRVGFDDNAAQQADAATAKTQGNFSKWNASASRLQGLSPENALYLSFSGQWANNNLDSAEKMIAGGPYTVRSYDMGALSGDTGYLGTAEFRHDLGSLWQGQWLASAFVDSEHVIVNKNAWTAGANSATLSGAGLGLNWAGPNEWSARAYVAMRLGSIPTLLASASSTRAWIEIGKGF